MPKREWQPIQLTLSKPMPKENNHIYNIAAAAVSGACLLAAALTSVIFSDTILSLLFFCAALFIIICRLIIYSVLQHKLFKYALELEKTVEAAIKENREQNELFKKYVSEFIVPFKTLHASFKEKNVRFLPLCTVLKPSPVRIECDEETLAAIHTFFDDDIIEEIENSAQNTEQPVFADIQRDAAVIFGSKNSSRKMQTFLLRTALSNYGANLFIAAADLSEKKQLKWLKSSCINTLPNGTSLYADSYESALRVIEVISSITSNTPVIFAFSGNSEDFDRLISQSSDILGSQNLIFVAAEKSMGKHVKDEDCIKYISDDEWYSAECASDELLAYKASSLPRTSVRKIPISFSEYTHTPENIPVSNPQYAIAPPESTDSDTDLNEAEKSTEKPNINTPEKDISKQETLPENSDPLNKIPTMFEVLHIDSADKLIPAPNYTASAALWADSDGKCSGVYLKDCPFGEIQTQSSGSNALFTLLEETCALNSPDELLFYMLTSCQKRSFGIIGYLPHCLGIDIADSKNSIDSAIEKLKTVYDERKRILDEFALQKNLGEITAEKYTELAKKEDNDKEMPVIMAVFDFVKLSEEQKEKLKQLADISVGIFVLTVSDKPVLDTDKLFEAKETVENEINVKLQDGNTKSLLIPNDFSSDKNQKPQRISLIYRLKDLYSK